MARKVNQSQLEAALGPFDEVTPIGGASGSGEAWRVKRGSEVRAIKIVVHEHEPGRFQREVAALKRLTSQRVMRILGDGTMTAGGASYPYLISEFVDGVSVRDALASRGAPSDDDLRGFLVTLFKGLEDLRSVEVVHRDLKPENIVLRAGDWTEPVIIDLGLSRLIDATSFTIYPWAYGTWPYMAPEQLRAERAIYQSDVWAVAVIGAELAAGSHPFRKAGETTPPADWDDRLRAGIPVSGSRPAALRDLVAQAGDYRAYRRPNAERARMFVEANWT